MNREHLAKNVNRVVRLRPAAMTRNGARVDDDWKIVEVTDSRAKLARVSDSAPLVLGLDHIHRYSSDPGRDEEPNAPFGFLVLTEKVVRNDDGRFVVEVVLPGDAERRAAEAPSYTPEVLDETRTQYGKLVPLQKSAVARLMLVGEMTDREMKRYLSEAGLAHGAESVLQQLANTTSLVRRVLAALQYGEHVNGYTGPYVVNPAFREALRDVMASS